jgi:Leucine-rich repeat (LRR) protein
MKNLYTFVLVLLCAFIGKAQIINFPDAAFKAKLLFADVTNQIASTETPVYTASDNGVFNWSVSSYNKIDSNSDGEIQVSEASAIKYLNISESPSLYGSIANIAGIESFVNLLVLKCSYNVITNLNVSGLTNLKYLDCSNNQLPSLNLNSLTNLQILFCSNNQIPSLDVSGLTFLQNLICSKNQIPSLDVSGLTFLQYLDCSYNQLLSLNVSGLTNLQTLYCSYNQITILNWNGLTNLQTLSCMNNQLLSLNVSVLTNLKYLNCSSNHLPSLDVSGLINLQNLYCESNQLVNINLNGITTSLTSLICKNNNLNSLDITNLSNINNLDCSHNQINTLNLVGHPNLYYLYCSFNVITSLNISDLNLSYLNCSNNQISQIDFTSCVHLFNLDCSYNLLTTANLNNIHIQTFCDDSACPAHYNLSHNNLISLYIKDHPYNLVLSFDGNPNIQFVCANDNQVTYIQNLATSYGYTNCQVNSYCSFAPGGALYEIKGNVRYDSNSNGCDSQDVIYPNLKLQIYGSLNSYSGYSICDTSGTYSIPVEEATHNVQTLLEMPDYFNVTPASFAVTFPSQTSPYNQDFCITANGVHNDLEVVVFPISHAIPGYGASYRIIYRNKGTNSQNGNVRLKFDDNLLNYVSAVPSAGVQIVNLLIWNFSNLAPFETRSIDVVLILNSPADSPPLNFGDSLTISSSINGATDETPADNMATINQYIINSFDPNAKTCLEGTTIHKSNIGKYVHYKIDFENTGTANAQNIVVKDIIDTTKFDLTSFVPLNCSFPYTTRIYGGNKIEFIFQNINLPFTSGNNKGYVLFKIKTLQTLHVGDTFSNTASIYFDYNFPIITNTASTAIQALATQDFEFSNYFTLYPNPAKNVLNINTKSSIEVHTITIYNQLGQVVLAIPNAKNLNSVDVSSLKTGNYFLKITSDKGSATEKFIKQ